MQVEIGISLLWIAVYVNEKYLNWRRQNAEWKGLAML